MDETEDEEDDDTGGDAEDSSHSDWSIFTDERIATEVARDSSGEESRIINLVRTCSPFPKVSTSKALYLLGCT
jgi:hypothetical protein